MKNLVLFALLLSLTSFVNAANPFNVSKGSLDTVGQGVTVTANSSDDFNTVTLQLSGTWAGTMEVFGSLDGSNYTQMTLAPVATGVGATSFTASGLYSGPLGGVRVIVARFTTDTSGTVSVRLAMTYGTNTLSFSEVETKTRTDVLSDNGTDITPKFVVVSASTSGDNTILAAVAGKKIRVTNVVLVSAGTVTIRFESGAGGTALTGQMPLVASSGIASGYDPTGHFETATNTLLNLELSAAVAVTGWIKYIEVD